MFSKLSNLSKCAKLELQTTGMSSALQLNKNPQALYFSIVTKPLGGLDARH